MPVQIITLGGGGFSMEPENPLYVTNIPLTLLSADEAVILGTTRWQVACLFDV